MDLAPRCDCPCMRVIRLAYPDLYSRPEPLYRRHGVSNFTTVRRKQKAAKAHSTALKADSTALEEHSMASVREDWGQSQRVPQLWRRELASSATATAHSPASPAASAPLDSPLASAASAPFNTLPPPAASVESRVSSAALHSCIRGRHLQQVRGCLPDGYWDNAVPPRKEVNTKMYGKDAENNFLARKSLSQCKKDPGDVYARYPHP